MIRKTKLMMVYGAMIGFATASCTHAETQKPEGKQRVIAMTDGEIDDWSSMIRFLLYTSDFDVEAIIETNSVWQREGHSRETWLEDQLGAYESVYPNLIKHHEGYPTADALRALCYVGDEDSTHLAGIRNSKEQVPGAPVEILPDGWEDTPGSERIIEILLKDDPRPVHIQAWGGGNTLSRALYKLKAEFPDRYDEAVAKTVVYNVSYQDDAGNYIEQYHPGVTMIHCTSFSGTWNYRVQTDTYDFIRDEVKNNHGPLGALYPQDYVSEGDSPAFMYVIANGLRNYAHPTWGGWGGRFTKTKKAPNTYRNAVDDDDNGDKRHAMRRWVSASNADFQARMDWCVAERYEDANHPPKVRVDVGTDITVKSGETVTLDASGSEDPDGDKLTFNWWQYREVGTYDRLVDFSGSDQQAITFTAPDVEEPKTIHFIVEAKDDGVPSLVGYQRVVVEVVP
ncbi:nucleoside hydrolase-like domain-containing protein [Parapedobacter sp. 2B3]|uniref:DUF1593 domain-containing protein n=1 Tax=Parapedobacter sp. 2B3 TaxID=3342381 RepID=UPI0035B58B33